MVKKKTSIPFFENLLKLDFTSKKQGFISVLIGIVLALLTGGFAVSYNWTTTWIYWVLALGVIVGILNIFHEEAILFLITGLALTFMSYLLAGLAIFPEWISTLFNAIIYLLAPASLIVSIKLIYALASK